MAMPETDREPELHVALEHVLVCFGTREVLRDLSCGFRKSRISVILGGSGSGKSTLLKVIAGLVRPRKGRVLVAGEDLVRLPERQLYEVRKRIGMMFQNGALLDSMNVFDNLALPLREHRKLTPEEIATEVHERLEAVGLTNVDHLLPGQLSGGMVKRVALARAIIARPEILLCDEPFSGLDPVSTKRIEALLKTINRRYGMTTIVVSHHIPTTMRMAEHVLALLPDGQVEGTPEELRASRDPRVVNFLNEDAGDTPGLADEVEVLPTAGTATRRMG
ncbi:MAG: phospholipid/cholesterol/gamma-HCH transport system ATP-binding protein [Candidatus Binatota bacterium]|nr:phospholipid/cholesterol/gamma-HCH transport system ATP-binding protein [Candidatus Binatota bacterium]